MTTPINQLRRNYERGELSEATAHADPLHQFDLWFHEARAAGLLEPNAMTLATADAAGAPSARIILLKGYDQHGLVFFGNYDSRKGRDLAANPRAALCFWWETLERQVRITGVCERIAPAESDAYFHSRPRASQLGALASAQSSVISNRETLEARLAALTHEHEGRRVLRPDNWGGWRLVPDAFEFWQGRESRLHDRLRYTHTAEGVWRLERLAP